MAKREGEKETRTKSWTLVLYPESVPENWREIIDEHHIQWLESPLHDRDVTATGELKKAHWHILMLFGTLKSFDQVKEFTRLLNGPIPERCHDARALTRYMAHLDDPNKAQYPASNIKSHGGADLAELLRPSSSERYEFIKEMAAYIKLNNIVEFQDIVDYSIENEPDRWFPALCDNSAFIIMAYIKSQRHRVHNVIQIDGETGEILGIG